MRWAALVWTVVAYLSFVFVATGAAAVKQSPPPKWEDIAAFYSGGNMKGPITYDWENSLGTTGLPESGSIRLNPKLIASRDAFLKQWFGKDQSDKGRQNALIAGLPFLNTLLHEAIHNRNFRGSGFADAGDELQAGDLGYRLIPDMLQRFFGVDINSPAGQQAVDMIMRRFR